MSQLFASSGQSTGVSASTSVISMNTQDWSPLGWTGWISLQSKGLSRVFSNTTVQSINSSGLSFLHSPTLTFIHDHWKIIALTRWTFVGKVMSLLFNMQSSLVIISFQGVKCLLISLQFKKKKKCILTFNNHPFQWVVVIEKRLCLLVSNLKYFLPLSNTYYFIWQRYKYKRKFG